MVKTVGKHGDYSPPLKAFHINNNNHHKIITLNASQFGQLPAHNSWCNPNLSFHKRKFNPEESKWMVLGHIKYRSAKWTSWLLIQSPKCPLQFTPVSLSDHEEIWYPWTQVSIGVLTMFTTGFSALGWVKKSFPTLVMKWATICYLC